MDDIVKRLMDSRALCSYGLAALLEEATLEIKRLRAQVAEFKNVLSRDE
jgi:hypothetical protein